MTQAVPALGELTFSDVRHFLGPYGYEDSFVFSQFADGPVAEPSHRVLLGSAGCPTSLTGKALEWFVRPVLVVLYISTRAPLPGGGVWLDPPASCVGEEKSF